MVIKTRKQSSGKTQATLVERDKSPLVIKSNMKRAGREGKGFGSFLPNVISASRAKLGLTPGAFMKLGGTLLLGKLSLAS